MTLAKSHSLVDTFGVRRLKGFLPTFDEVACGAPLTRPMLFADFVVNFVRTVHTLEVADVGGTCKIGKSTIFRNSQGDT